MACTSGSSDAALEKRSPTQAMPTAIGCATMRHRPPQSRPQRSTISSFPVRMVLGILTRSGSILTASTSPRGEPLNAFILLLFAADPTGLQAAFESAETVDMTYDRTGFKVTLVNPETIKKLARL